MALATRLGHVNGCTIEMLRAQPRQGAVSTSTMPITIKNGEIMKNIHRASTHGEMFVLPSQMNGAEYPSPNNIITDILEYASDNTGGPRGQLACDLDVAQFICDNASNDNNPGGINYVGSIIASTPSIDLKNGYLTENPRATQADCRTFVGQVQAMEVLLSRNIAVTGMVPSFPLRNNTPRAKASLATAKRVDLVYASAVPFEAYGNGGSKEWERVCKKVLTQQYYLALAAAARCIKLGKHKRYTVHCLPLGGGVFNNEREWIYIALRQAVIDAQVSFLTPSVARALTVCILCWEGNPAEFAHFSKLREEDTASAKASAGASAVSADGANSTPSASANESPRKSVGKAVPATLTLNSMQQLAKAAKIKVGNRQFSLRDHQVFALVKYLQGMPTDEFQPPLAQLRPNQLPRYVAMDGTLHPLVLRPADKALVSAARSQEQSTEARLAKSARLHVGNTMVPLRDHQQRAFISYLHGHAQE